jgi:DNA-binding beta-propeller fold protein YncE
VSVIDLVRDSLVRTIDAGERIEGVTINPDATEVWTGANEAKVVFVFNPATGERVAKIEGFGMPYRMSITPDGATAIVSDPGAERVHIVDAKTHRIRQTLDMTTLLGLSGDEAAHPSPQGVILSRDGRFAFITLKALGKVAVINIATGAVIKTLTVGGGSDGVGYSPVAARARTCTLMREITRRDAVRQLALGAAAIAVGGCRQLSATVATASDGRITARPHPPTKTATPWPATDGARQDARRAALRSQAVPRRRAGAARRAVARRRSGGRRAHGTDAAVGR